MPPCRQAILPAILGPEGPNPCSFQSISILLHANTSLIAPQCSYAYLFPFPTQRLIVCTPVPCSHPRPLLLHADSRPSYRHPPVSVPIAYMSWRPCGLVSISSSLALLYFPSSIIISLFPIEHCFEDYLASILLIRRGLRHWDAPRNLPLLLLNRHFH